MKEGLALLLVEDDEVDARIVERVAKRGLPAPRLTRAADIADARAHVSAQVFDVALLDLGLPDAVADDAVTALRRAAPQLPIVVLSGNEDETIVERLVRRGAEDYLPKSELGETRLRRAITRAIELRSTRDRATRRNTRRVAEFKSTRAIERLQALTRFSAAVARFLEEEGPTAPLKRMLASFRELEDTPQRITARQLSQDVSSGLPPHVCDFQISSDETFVAYAGPLRDALRIMILLDEADSHIDPPRSTFIASDQSLEVRTRLSTSTNALTPLQDLAYAVCREVAAAHAGSAGVISGDESSALWIRIGLPTGL